ncbi:hypothetical protein K9M74_01790 [Candidatus Woesearchaeota archaeon]|nr:hypothetical protein [Candidatus Woesearchaeota archaeon]
MLILLFLLLSAPALVNAQQNNLNVNNSLTDDDFVITYSPTQASIDFNCTDNFNSVSECEKSCSESCVLKEGYCFACEKTKKNSFLSRLWNTIKGLMQTTTTSSQKDEKQKITPETQFTTNSELIANITLKVITQQPDKNTAVAIRRAMENASIQELFKLKRVINEYCRKKQSTSYGNYIDNPECKYLMNELKKRGDMLKEETFANIQQDDPDFVKKLNELQALLEVSLSATGEESFFSKENIEKINRETKKKFRKWFEAQLVADNDSLEEAVQLYILIKSMERANDDYTNAESKPGLLGNDIKERIENAKYNVARQLLRKIFEIDVCNPDPAKLEELKKLLRPKTKVGNPRLFCYEMAHKEACDNIFSGDLVSAYTWLYDKGDFKNNNPEQLPAPPIDCTNKTIQQDIKKSSIDLQNTTSLNSSTLANSTNQTTQKIPTPQTTSNQELPEETQEVTQKEIQQITQEEQEIIPLSCEVLITKHELVGWEYELLECRQSFEESIMYWNECGFPPPTIMVEPEGFECYETMDNSIDTNLIVPCQPRPVPPPEVVMCVEQFLNEQPI